MTPAVWIVEMAVEYPRKIRWEPCREVGLTREEAMVDCRGFRARNPHDRFQVRCYTRKAKP